MVRLGRAASGESGLPEDFWIYVAAATSLVALGVAFRGLFLNWIIGPAFVIAFVAGARWLRERRRAWFHR